MLKGLPSEQIDAIETGLNAIEQEPDGRSPLCAARDS